jgi:hypothetical protein
VGVWLSNDVLACWGLAVAWLKRGASAHEVPGIRHARHGFVPEVREDAMAVVMIGADPHKASHTAVATRTAEEPLGQLRVRAPVDQAQRLLAWAQAWPERTWAVEGADGVGHLLAQQLLAAGERVLDIQPRLSADRDRRDGQCGPGHLQMRQQSPADAALLEDQGARVTGPARPGFAQVTG